MSKHIIEPAALQATLKSYQARMDSELRGYSNSKRHVYWSDPLQKYIVVRSKNGKFELEFTSTCPCGSNT